MKDKNKNVRTKTSKSERVEFRCTTAFKSALTEIAEQRGITVTSLVESLCTDEIHKHFDSMSVQKDTENPVPVHTKNTTTKEQPAIQKPSHSNDYEREIWRLMQEGETPTKTAQWLNQNGYKPQRGTEFTLNSVHSIRRRLKRQNGEP
ncbi:recombinase family protein [Vibrio vulnificus]